MKKKTPAVTPKIVGLPPALTRTPRTPAPPSTPRPVPTPQPIKETNEQKQSRVEAANKALKALCDQYHVSFHVPSLDISSGKIWPVIQLIALDLP